jgi:hypothetical protein
VAGCVLHVLKRHAGLPGAGHECHPQTVRADLAGAVEGRSSGNASDHAPRLGLTHALAGRRDEERTGGSACEGGVDGPDDRSGQHRTVASAALAVKPEHPVSSVVAQVLDVSGQCLTDTHAGGGEQLQEGDGAGAAVFGRSSEQSAQLVSAEPRCLAPVANAGPADVLDGREHPDFFVDEEAVPAGNRGDLPGNGAGPVAGGFKRPGPGVDVGAPDVGQRVDVVVGAERQPGGDVCVVGPAGVHAGEPEQPSGYEAGRRGASPVAAGPRPPAAPRPPSSPRRTATRCRTTSARRRTRTRSGRRTRLRRHPSARSRW